MALRDLNTDYAGRKGPMFRLALKTGILTILTLGFYRFWMKVRMRRYYWSAIRPGGIPLEFTGRGSETLTGFLTAVTVLAFYIGVINLVLMYFSFSLFQGNMPAYFVSAIGVAPMIFFAQYRSRRYILARTRWRGIRFGLEPGVKGYIWRALLWWLAVIVTGGLLWPAKTYALEKYRTDRTWFGDQRFEQTGGMRGMFHAMRHVYLGVALMAVFGTLAYGLDEPVWVIGAIMGGIWTVLGLAYWRAMSFGYLTEGKKLGEAGFQCRPRPISVIGIYLGGGLLISLILTGLFIVIGLGFGILIGIVSVIDVNELFDDLGMLADLPIWVLTLFGTVAYFAMFLFWNVLQQVFITMPLARHLAESTRLVNTHALPAIGQRDRDEFAEAEGFADALPLGDGI